MRFPIALKIVILSFTSSGLIIALLTIISYQDSYNEIEDKLGLTLRQIALTSTAGISGDEHSKIVNPADAARPEFLKIHNILHRIMELNELTPDTIYTFRITPDRELRFGVMLHAKPFVGDSYTPPERNKKLIEQVLQGRAVKTGIYTDVHGDWISGLAPIRNSRGKVVGILEVDFRVNRFLAEVNNRTQRLLLVSGFVLLMGLGLGLWGARAISEPVRRLQTAANNLKEKNYEIQVRVESNDEMKDLAQTFNVMADSIRHHTLDLETRIAEKTSELMQANEEANGMLEEIKEKEASLRNIFNSANDAILILNPRTAGIHETNPQAAIMLGYNQSDLQGMSVARIHPDEMDLVNGFIKRISSGESVFTDQLSCTTKSHRVVPVEISFSPVTIEGDAYVMAIVRDISERIQMERNIRANEDRYVQFIMDTHPNFILATNNQEIEYINQTFLNFLEFDSLDEFKEKEGDIGKYIIKINGKTYMREFDRDWLKSMVDSPEEDHIIYFKNPRNSAEEIVYIVVNRKFPELERYIFTFTEITDIEKEKLLLENQANTDTLTQIYNRLKFNELIEREIFVARRLGAPFSLIMFDIDYFKKVNDLYGHLAGDRVLEELAALIKENIRGSDSFARWGGEEFMVLSPKTILSHALIQSENLRRLVEEYNFEGIEGVTCSFGVSQFREEDTPASLLGRVDPHLYAAKNGGRNQVYSDVEAEQKT